jgi:hypothetical protein
VATTCEAMAATAIKRTGLPACAQLSLASSYRALRVGQIRGRYVHRSNRSFKNCLRDNGNVKPIPIFNAVRAIQPNSNIENPFVKPRSLEPHEKAVIFRRTQKHIEFGFYRLLLVFCGAEYRHEKTKPIANILR